jgi:DNA invertase Pin-like site-specific DNA recombinase
VSTDWLQDVPAADEGLLRRRHFTALSRDEQASAIRRLAASGQGEHTIVRATGLSVEQVRRILLDEVAPILGVRP